MCNDIIFFNAEAKDNYRLFALFLDDVINGLDEKVKNQYFLLSFDDFIKKYFEFIIAPRKPNKPVCMENNPNKVAFFEMVYRQALQQHNKKLSFYEQKIEQQKRLKLYPPDEKGYVDFLANNKAFITPFLSKNFPFPIKEKHREKHTYITGGTGSGKSEAIKTYIWHYLTRNQTTGIILLTPHSEIAQQVAKFKVNIDSGRLVYINPLLAVKYNKYPCINPFDLSNKENLSDIEVEMYAEGFREVFEELLQANFTEQMNALLKNTLPVILKKKDSSIYDLLDFLEPDGEKVNEYIAFANENIKNPVLLYFLNGQFLNDQSYKRTKSALHTRLHSLFSSTIMQALLKGKSTINLEQLTDNKKLIIFDFSKGEMPLEWNILGKFVIASIKILSFRRSKKSFSIPCHLFIDECQNFITPSLQEILEESRKYRLYLTLAQQQAGARMSGELIKSILGNTGIKMAGRNGDISTLETFAKSTGAKIEDLQNLKTGQFSLWTVSEANETPRLPVIVTMPRNTLNDTQSMNAKQWETLENEQIHLFYRAVGEDSRETPQTPLSNEKEMNFDCINGYLN